MGILQQIKPVQHVQQFQESNVCNTLSDIHAVTLKHSFWSNKNTNCALVTKLFRQKLKWKPETIEDTEWK